MLLKRVKLSGRNSRFDHPAKLPLVEDHRAINIGEKPTPGLGISEEEPQEIHIQAVAQLHCLVAKELARSREEARVLTQNIE